MSPSNGVANEVFDRVRDQVRRLVPVFVGRLRLIGEISPLIGSGVDQFGPHCSAGIGLPAERSEGRAETVETRDESNRTRLLV
jgi:hypothetical protein